MSFIRRVRKRARDRGASESGAALVEFAIMMPLLLLLLFGIIEFGWVLSQNLDVRHGAREGARLAAVNFPDGPPPDTGTPATNMAALVDEVCTRMQTPTDVKVFISRGGNNVGDPATVRVTAPAKTLTGFLDWAIPSTLILDSEVQIRMEQVPTWAETALAGEPCP